jgi:glycine oxidase
VSHADVVVIGGGVIGSAVAFALAREQLSVALLERDAVGAHASRVAAGMLAPLAEGRDGDTLPLGFESLAMFPELAAELRERTGIDPGFVRSGVLRVATGPGEAARLRARAGALAEHDVEWLDPDELRLREPALAAGVRGALWSPREAQVASESLTAAYAGAARTLGARIECGSPAIALLRDRGRVSGVRTPAGEWRAPWVVLASGPWAGSDASALGVDPAPPVEPVRGQILTLRPDRPLLRAIAWDERVYLVPRPDGRVLAGASEERAGFACHTTAAGVRDLLDAAAELAPALARAELLAARAGLRPGTPDGLPLIGPAPALPGLVLAVGHHRNGILLSPITGRLVADVVTGKMLPEAARAFDPGRFVPGAGSLADD